VTTAAFTPSPTYTIAGTGPYSITHPYSDGDEILVEVWAGAVKTDLVKDVDYTVSPDAGGSTTTGDITLSAGAATTHAGSTLVPRRKTVTAQGWLGLTGPREKGLEAQLDRNVMSSQDTQEGMDRSIKVVSGAISALPGVDARKGKALRFDEITGDVGVTSEDPDKILALAQLAASDAAADAVSTASDRAQTGLDVGLSSAAATKASDWAEEVEGTEVEIGQYSALHHAAKAAESAASITPYTHPNHTGDVTSAGDGGQTIAARAVTFAKMQAVATSKVLGRVTTGSGDAEELTGSQITQLLDAPLVDLAGITYTAGDLLYYDGTNLVNLGIGIAGQALVTNAGATAPEWGGAGKVLQVVNYQTGVLATGTGVIANDDTIPQNTEGTQFMSLGITPKSATSTLHISVSINTGYGANSPITTALFVDSVADALAAVIEYEVNGGQANHTLLHAVASGSTTARTYKVRAGHASGSLVSFNGHGGAARFGGVMGSGITIMEVSA